MKLIPSFGKYHLLQSFFPTLPIVTHRNLGRCAPRALRSLGRTLRRQCLGPRVGVGQATVMAPHRVDACRVAPPNVPLPGKPIQEYLGQTAQAWLSAAPMTHMAERRTHDTHYAYYVISMQALAERRSRGSFARERHHVCVSR